MTKLKIGTSSNYDYYVKTDTSKYVGQWIAIANKKVVAHGKDAEKVYKSASKKISSDKISLAKVPKAQVMILRLSL